MVVSSISPVESAVLVPPDQNGSVDLVSSWVDLRIEERRRFISDCGMGLAWVELPVDLRTFTESPMYLNLPKHIGHGLSQVQFNAVWNVAEIFDVEAAVRDPFNVVIRPKQVQSAVLMWGMGSGKDLCAGLIQARLLYLLGCLADPHAAIGASRHKGIDLLNVAVSSDQAEEKFFDPLKRMLRDSPWFMERLCVKLMDTRVCVPPIIGHDEKVGDMYSINAWSGSSAQESELGGDLLCVVLDEIDAFPSFAFSQGGDRRMSTKITADSMYRVMLATILSRFPVLGKLVMLSWPRYQGSFIMRKLEDGKGDPTVYADGPRNTWDVNPKRSSDEYDALRKKNPELVAAMYECKPSQALKAYFASASAVLETFHAKRTKDFEVVQNDADPGRPAPVNWEKMQVIPELIGKPDRRLAYCWHVDLGLRGGQGGDRAAAAMAHHSGWFHDEDMDEWVPVVCLDLLFYWEASPGEDIQFSDVRRMILDVARKGYRTVLVTYDGWQSEDSRQLLRRYTQFGRRMRFRSDGTPMKDPIEAKYLSVDANTAAYDTLKELCYESGRLDAFYCKLLVEELLGLIRVISGAGKMKVDHLDGASKDAADAVAGAVFNATKNLSDAVGRPAARSESIGCVMVGAKRDGETSVDDELISVSGKITKKGVVKGNTDFPRAFGK